MSRDDGPDRFGAYRIIGYPDPEVPQDREGNWVAQDREGDWERRHFLIREAEMEAREFPRPDVTVSCLPRAGCGDQGNGASLASVYLTRHGVLWSSRLVLAHNAVPSFQEMHPDALVMRHPLTGGVAEVTRRAFEAVWRHKGWQEAPRAALKAAQRWRPQRVVRVLDLVDRRDLPHVTLRVRCSRHGRAVVEADRLLAHTPTRRTGRACVVPLSALCRVVG